MTQRERVLQMLRQAGSRGIHTFELRREFVGNPSQRIAELEAEGHRITHTRERLHGDAVGTRYRLVSEQENTSTGAGQQSRGRLAPPGPTLADGHLFDPRGLSKPAGPYDELDAA